MGVTTSDIAKKAGVSQTTVSLVLNNNSKIAISSETKELVLRTAAEMGYQFKKREKKEKKNIIGLLVPTLSNLYYPFLVQNIENYANSIGITVVVQNTMRSEQREIQCFDFLRSIDASGILCLYTPKATVKDMPMVLVGEKTDDIDLDVISLNCFEAGKIAAEHLLELGYKDIAYISTPFTNITDARRKRLEGIQQAMEQAGVLERLITLVDNDEDESMDVAYEMKCGAKLAEQLLEQYPDCKAIIAVNDMTAMGCMDVLIKRGIRIPEDMVICSFDNLFLDDVIQPKLTSVEQMAFHGCKMGLNILKEKMKNSYKEEHLVYLEYKPELHVRESTMK